MDRIGSSGLKVGEYYGASEIGRFRRQLGKLMDMKKACVALQEGKMIDVTIEF